jgi:nucleoside-triphosphatase THEP1
MDTKIKILITATGPPGGRKSTAIARILTTIQLMVGGRLQVTEEVISRITKSGLQERLTVEGEFSITEIESWNPIKQ